MTTLTRLSVGGNTAIPTSSQKILSAWAGQVTKLDFSRSCITALPTDISILTRLTELELHHNELKTIPPQIGDLTNLRVLDLSHNPQMESLPVQMWKLTNLQKLNIEGNHPNMYDGPIKPNMETSAILAVLKQQASSQIMQPCYRLKLMLVGQENVGKTTLAKALKVFWSAISSIACS
jgi:Leucine-rich repeat (LRR) protein